MYMPQFGIIRPKGLLSNLTFFMCEITDSVLEPFLIENLLSWKFMPLKAI